VVADIGAGSGWFTVRVAKRVTETGRVYAVDINPETIRYINQRIQKENLHNVKTILSKPDDPLLPANKIDSVLLLKTHHEVEKPVTLLRNLRPSLRTGAKVGVIDRNGNGENHGVAREVVIREASQAGYTSRAVRSAGSIGVDPARFILRKTSQTLKSDYHCRARRRSWLEARTRPSQSAELPNEPRCHSTTAIAI
jgi:ubiquinone/menaquinone biosynthesis C-methylase UbiE